MDDEVAEGSVQYNFCWVSVSRGTEVTVGGEDICDAVSDDNDWAASCAFKCIHGEQRDGGQEEDGEELVPLHAWEDCVENVETPNPEDNSEESIIVDDNNFGNRLNHDISVLNFFFEEIFYEIHNYFH